MSLAKRWKPKELEALKESEKICREMTGHE
jgi:hypothetical protein